MMMTYVLKGLPCAAVLMTTIGCGSSSYLGPVADSTAAREIRDIFNKPGAGDSGDAATVETGTGWATLRGRFVYDGDPPTMPAYDANKDQATCAPGGKAPLQETLVVDSATGGIKNIAIYLRKASRVHESAQKADEPLEFDQKSCVFLSHVFACLVGQTVELKNSDNVGHNTNITGKKNTFNQTIPAGESVAFNPQKEEATPAPVSCSIHPWMKAYLLPRENGYFAVTADDGSFEIPNLPAGESLELQVWHESATGRGSFLVLTTPAAKELKWSSNGRIKIKLEEGETKEIELAVPPTAFQI